MARYKFFNAELFIQNRKKLAKLLPEKSLVILESCPLLRRNGDQNYPFRQDSNLFYLSGLDQEKTIVLLYLEHPDKELKEAAFIIKNQEKDIIWNGYKYSIKDAQKISGIEQILYLEEIDQYLYALAASANNIFFNSEPSILKKKLRVWFPTKRSQLINNMIHVLRLTKSTDEIKYIEKACDITKLAFQEVLKKLSPGMNEYEIEAFITHEFIKSGASGHAYAPIVASGNNACILHYTDNDGLCKNGDLLLLDFGAEYGNYSADCSRTIPVNGTFTKRQKDCYNAVLRVFNKAKKFFVKGSTISAINKKVNLLLEEEMIQLGLFTKEQVKAQNPGKPLYFKYFMHGVSHFMGLDVHDPGNKEIKLEKGMVLTCEPGIYIREESIGIRLENDILIDDFPIDLMQNIPINADEIEKLMKKK
ncbi:MAG: X-Pro aminopeptidase [Marinilabiliales bacterium]|nr:MAG: X-Pro aminopeptidase [Marinilabiliales bacterium]